MSRDDRLDELYELYQNDPQFEYLRKDHPTTFFVPGDGPMSPDIMLIGEAPGRLENANRMPFVGRAGVNLANILQDLEIDIYYTFRTNVVKYWPRDGMGKTRSLDNDEIADARKYLLKEIEIVNPKIIGLCGHSAIKAIYPKIPHVHHSHAQLLDNKFVPLYHPATATYNVAKKPLVLSGYAKLKEYLGEMNGNSSATGDTIQRA